MNLLFLVILVLVPVQIALGYRAGLVKGLHRAIAWCAVALLFILVEMMIRFFKASNTMDGLICLILLIIVALCWRVISTILLPARILSKLPVVKGADKVLGVVFGILELMLLIWILDALVMNYTLGSYGMLLYGWIQENTFLRWTYENNYLLIFESWAEAKLIAQF